MWCPIFLSFGTTYWDSVKYTFLPQWQIPFGKVWFIFPSHPAGKAFPVTSWWVTPQIRASSHRVHHHPCALHWSSKKANTSEGDPQATVPGWTVRIFKVSISFVHITGCGISDDGRGMRRTFDPLLAVCEREMIKNILSRLSNLLCLHHRPQIRLVRVCVSAIWVTCALVRFAFY